MNYAPHNSQCYVDLPLEFLNGSSVEFRDLMSNDVYVREKAGLTTKGMFFDMEAYGLHIFHVSPLNRNHSPAK